MERTGFLPRAERGEVAGNRELCDPFAVNSDHVLADHLGLGTPQERHPFFPKARLPVDDIDARVGLPRVAGMNPHIDVIPVLGPGDDFALSEGQRVI